MTKNELIFKVAALCRLPTSQTQAVINATLDVIRDELVAEREVNIIGFGKFSVRNVAARKVRNPRTGEVINLPPNKRVHFTAGK